MNVEEPVIALRGVSKRFGRTLDLAARLARRARRALGGTVRDEVVRAVDNVDMVVRKGEVVGLVGESGCGKSTIGRMVAGILAPSEGAVLFKGHDLTTLDAHAARAAKLKVQMIFQDPYASLNPRMRVAEIVGEAPRVHGMIPRGQFDAYVDAQLRRAGLDPAFKRRYPHQFSGGQRQRIGIARALALDPEILVADEAVSALDVSVQAQVLALLEDLKQRLGLSMLFITHDLRVAAQVCDRIAVMQHGKLLEVQPTAALFAAPQHPYTQELLAAVPGAAMVARSA